MGSKGSLKSVVDTACSVYWQWLLQPLIALGTHSVQCSLDPSTLSWLLYHVTMVPTCAVWLFIMQGIYPVLLSNNELLKNLEADTCIYNAATCLYSQSPQPKEWQHTLLCKSKAATFIWCHHNPLSWWWQVRQVSVQLRISVVLWAGLGTSGLLHGWRMCEDVYMSEVAIAMVTMVLSSLLCYILTLAHWSVSLYDEQLIITNSLPWRRPH